MPDENCIVKLKLGCCHAVSLADLDSGRIQRARLIVHSVSKTWCRIFAITFSNVNRFRVKNGCLYATVTWFRSRTFGLPWLTILELVGSPPVLIRHTHVSDT